jgi:hypothetical protein
LVTQLPVQVPIPPFWQSSVHCAGAFVQSSVQVDPPSHTTWQAPPGQVMLHVDIPSQSDWQLPPVQA